jgi:hypothetical protein
MMDAKSKLSAMMASEEHVQPQTLEDALLLVQKERATSMGAQKQVAKVRGVIVCIMRVDDGVWKRVRVYAYGCECMCVNIFYSILYSLRIYTISHVCTI